MSVGLWDSVDSTFQDDILAYAGPLTQYLNGRLTLDSPIAERAVIAEAYAREWPGDLASLPNAFGMRHVRVHAMIRSKPMRSRYERLYGPVRREYPFVNAYDRFDPWREPAEDIPTQTLDDIALRNCWIDDLAPLLAYAGSDLGVDLAKLAYAPATYDALLDYVAGEGYLDVLEVLHAAGSSHCTAAAMDKAAAAGHLDVVTWLHAHRTEGCTSDAFDASLLQGHDDVLTFLQAHRSEGHSPHIVEIAVRSGKLSAVETLHRLGLAFSPAAMDVAAACGHDDIVTFLHMKRSDGCSVAAMDGAARHGHLRIVQFLHTHRHEGCSPAALDGAAFNNHLDVVQFLHRHRREGGTTHGMDRAAHRGHATMVEYLHRHRSEGCTTRAIDWAASSGHLEIVAFLSRHRFEGFTYKAVLWAATKGHKDVVRLLGRLDAPQFDRVRRAIAEAKVAMRHDKASYLQEMTGVVGADDDILRFGVLVRQPDEDDYTDWDADQMDDDFRSFEHELRLGA
ncbi:hypothetical protein SPRG_13279 [Saprolegnia parasitica CBS 223.65]|uniref:Ankyrin repeat protein n=1 Tax=Saprolegnia parasitica (strain CBS 223.65) TaxID=695850 RepID=A0A067BTK8_SAPPC|nr:hypothetical protein SPRG_13279 [Saprolegnia parasitica CBS 223.65]KDO21593.1 hypothetical protein SPRG_13279 [Saprolegnia parasitica CBS 223.65]|eukprot:XP_012207684.1 hypothetical protein SPRG_13279 [Saprolegnia parasitica CBS 223.65]